MPSNDTEPAGDEQDSGANESPPCDEFPVRRKSVTAGVSMSRGEGRVTLHNHESPCAAAERIKDPTVAKLGAEVPPRPELKKLCDNCDWPDGAPEALRRTPKRYRRNTEAQ